MKRKINNIQALRAYAALVVVVFHTEYRIFGLHPFGNFGVTVFFVISGFIMAGICETNQDAFFLRRLVRIVPPYWVATLLVFVLAWFSPALLAATRPSWIELIKSLFFIPFIKSNGLPRPMLFVGWSLNFEMFFYLVLALSIRLFPRKPTVLAACIIIISILTLHPFAQKNVFAWYYSEPMQLNFITGMAAYYFCHSFPEEKAKRWRVVSLLLVFISMAGLILYQGTGVWIPAKDWVNGIFSLVMVVAADLASRGGWDTNARWLVLIGDASYILYLCHMFVTDGFDKVLGHRVHWLKNNSLPGFILAVLASVLVAVVIHLKLERPVVTWLNRLVKKRGPVQITVKA